MFTILYKLFMLEILFMLHRRVPLYLLTVYYLLTTSVTSAQILSRLPRSDKLKGMIKVGIPHSLRPQIWMRTSGALEKKHKAATSYNELVKASSNDNLMTSKQIERVR